MALTVVAWNIQDLSWNKITGDTERRLRTVYILDTVEAIDADIFVVIEVETGSNKQGSIGDLIEPTSGGPAVSLLLQALRHFVDPDWCVVPPIMSGGERRKEGIAVFFNSAKVAFRGPSQINAYPGSGKTVVYRSRDIAATADTYPAPWQNALPTTRPPGGDFGPHGDIQRNQNQLAGKAIFQVPGATSASVMGFPLPNSRAPFLTEFYEMATQRTFKIMSVHLPPKRKVVSGKKIPAEAGDAMANIATLPEIVGPIADNEVRLVLGDFNINTLNPDHAPCWTPLTAVNVPTSSGTTRYELLTAQDYAASHLLGPTDAKLDGQAPYYSYVSRGRYWDTDAGGLRTDPSSYPAALDSIYGAWGPGTAHPGFGWVINRIAPWPADVPPYMNRSIKQLRSSYLSPKVRDLNFQKLENFGAIRATSDHMAVQLVI